MATLSGTSAVIGGDHPLAHEQEADQEHDDGRRAQDRHPVAIAARNVRAAQMAHQHRQPTETQKDAIATIAKRTDWHDTPSRSLSVIRVMSAQ